ncbi:hypothetical protein HYW32_00625 [Candidatus Berkelbacteria bacterium]|nr:hypothetical protein [Candidatus Berkelbacteria bacterium]
MAPDHLLLKLGPWRKIANRRLATTITYALAVMAPALGVAVFAQPSALARHLGCPTVDASIINTAPCLQTQLGTDTAQNCARIFWCAITNYLLATSITLTMSQAIFLELFVT